MQIQRVLMCKPTYFDIEYSINPYMDVNNRVNKEEAQRQWDFAHDVLKSLGVAIELIDPVAGLPDMTFTGDCGMVFGKKFIASNFRHAERQGEVEPYANWLRNHGYTMYTIPQHIFFEGLGDIIYWDNDIVFGYGPRSSPEAITEVKNILPELNVLGELDLKDDSFYHTALAIAFIGKGTVIYYPDAFTEKSQRFIERSFKTAIAVDERDAKEYFVCNNIVIGKTILIDNCTQQLASSLEDMGYRIIKCDMSEFKKSGGSVRCLILSI